MNRTDVGHILLIIVIAASLIFVSYATKAETVQGFKDGVGVPGPSVNPNTIPSQIVDPGKTVQTTNLQTDQDKDRAINTGKVAKKVRQNKDGSLDLF